MRTRTCCWLLIGLCLWVPATAREATGDLLGAWRFNDGSVITIAPSADATWRYRQMHDGRSGRLHPTKGGWQAGPGFSDREPAALVVQLEGDRLRWSPTGEQARFADRAAVREQTIEWEVAGTTLHGRLVLPDTPGPHPVVVHVHGSERLPAVGQWHDPYMLAAHGIAGFVYDKRGTGRSDGEFTANFRTLAGDAAAAAELLAKRPGIDADRIGFAGFSQGGWVAPLAAERFGRAAAVLVGYGMVDSPLHEDRWQCLRLVRASGAAAGELVEAELLVDATHRLLTSALRDGWPEYKAVVRRSSDRPWFEQLDPAHCMAASFAAYPAWMIRTFAGRRLPPDLDWRYDSHAVLAASQVPMLWLLAGKDSEAVVDDTVVALRKLTEAGKPFEAVVLAGAEHGMLMKRVGSSGDPEPTGYHPEYFARMLGFWTQRFAIDEARTP